MTDTHRSTPAFAGSLDQGGRVPDASTTRTTSPDASPGGESGVTLWREVDALGFDSSDPTYSEGYNDALGHVLAILERRGFSQACDRIETTRANPAAGEQTGFDGYGEARKVETGAGGPEIEHTPGGGATIADPRAGEAVLDASPEDAASIERVRDRLTADGWTGPGKAWLAGGPALVGPVALDPSPEEQRERFRAIAATPKPSAVAIRSALITAGHLSRQWRSFSLDGYAEDSDHVAAILDRLGVEVVTLELERDDLRAQLDRIAANAQPVDGTDLAELVQRARRWEEANRSAIWSRREAGKIMLELVGAVNDQVRKLAEATKLVSDAYPAVRLVNDWATWPDASLYAYAGAILAKREWGDIRRDAVAKAYHSAAGAAVFEAIAEIRKVARDRLGDDGFTIPPTYTDEQRCRAVTALHRAAGDALADMVGPVNGEMVDAVATALGLERAA